MKPCPPGLWIIAAIISLLMPSRAFAGMTPAEVKSFEFIKAKAQKGWSGTARPLTKGMSRPNMN